MKKILLTTTLILLFCLKSYSRGNIQLPTDTLTKKNLVIQLLRLGVNNPEIVLAQAILESGHFKSKLSKKYNNIFGMKMPERRYTTAITKSKSGYAVYEHWTACLEDYLVWQKITLEKYKANKMSRTQYLNYLDRVYCDVKGYSRQLTKIIRRNHKMFSKVEAIYNITRNATREKSSRLEDSVEIVSKN